MNYPQQATSDPYAFSLWPDASAASEEEMMAWAQAAGYAQPGLTTDNFSLDDLLDTSLAWGQSGTVPTTQPVSTRQLVVVLSYCSSCYAAGLFHLPLWHPV